jgi:3-oxoacyl-[acyl-carrier-protein] synthase II
MARRVVVTGLGAVTPIGVGIDAFWSALCAGRSGVGPITTFDASTFRTRIAAEVGEIQLPPEIDAREARRLDRFALFALVAAVEAWTDSCLSHHRLDPYEAGVLIGSSHGGESTVVAEVAHALTAERRKVSARLIPRMLGNMAAAQVAMHLRLRGPSFGVASACATGAQSIGEAAEIIRRGDAEVMVAGGTDACITPLTLAGDQAAGALSGRNESPATASRPFDVERDGFVIGEGAGVLVLEDEEHARRRGARVRGELAGYGATVDASHETRPDTTGRPAARAVHRALEKAGILPEDVDAVFAHATGTVLGDISEARALRLAFGPNLVVIPVTAIKSSLGHLMGAAGAVQVVAALKALETQTLPATLNVEDLDPRCPLNLVLGGPMETSLRNALSHSAGFGGHNVALILSSPRAES